MRGNKVDYIPFRSSAFDRVRSERLFAEVTAVRELPGEPFFSSYFLS